MGDQLHTAGQRVGVVRDLFGNVLQEVKADQAGIVIMLRRFHRVHIGDGLVHASVAGLVEPRRAFQLDLVMMLAPTAVR